MSGLSRAQPMLIVVLLIAAPLLYLLGRSSAGIALSDAPDWYNETEHDLRWTYHVESQTCEF